MPLQLQSAIGLIAIPLLAWVLGGCRREASLRVALVALALQVGLAALLLAVPPVAAVVGLANDVVRALLTATEAGTSLVFGYLGGAPLPFEESRPGAAYILAFRGLPLVLLVSALAALLTHWGILPAIVRAFAWALGRSFRIGGALGVATAANVFFGMVEAQVVIRPYLAKLTRTELLVMMTAGMATIAGTMLGLYAMILEPVIPGAAAQLVVASAISAPAAVGIAMIMLPETGTPTAGAYAPEREAAGAMDALVRGTAGGLRLFLSILATLIVFVALVHLADMALGLLPPLAGEPVSLERLTGWLMTPLAWIMGIPWAEARLVGELLGVKSVVNELVAYVRLAEIPDEALSPRSRLIATYALCGFANFGSVGIMTASLVTLVPERRAEIMRLGLWSLVTGLLATCSTGAVVGLLQGGTP